MTGFGSAQLMARIAPADAGEQARIREVLTQVARPRLTGSAGAAEVETYLRGELESLGYEVRQVPFSFSTVPGRWGVPAIGAVFGLGGAIAAFLAGGREGGAALAVLAAVAVLVGFGARYAREAIARLPWGRVETANWLVARPGARPRFIVMAHRDSKSQGIPLLWRAGAIAAALVAAPLLALLVLVSYAGPPEWRLGVPGVLLGLLCLGVGAVLALSWARNDSPGALDNGTGVAALVGLAARESASDDIAFLVTDGEELGLAGASAVARSLPHVRGVINLDGLDDAGDFQIVERYGIPPRGMAPHLVAALLGAAHALEVRALRRTLPLGIMVDHIPLAEAGLAAVTVMRGTRESLRRVHLRADAVGRLTGEGAAQAVALVSAALAVLRTDGATA